MTKPPLTMSREEAAHYLGMAEDPTFFDDAVKSGEMPKPRLSIDGKPIWARRDIDAAIEKLPHPTPEEIARMCCDE